MYFLAFQAPAFQYFVCINVLNEYICEMIMICIIVCINVSYIILSTIIHAIKKRFSVIVFVRDNLIAIFIREQSAFHFVILIHVNKQSNITITLLNAYSLHFDTILICLIPMPLEICKVLFELVSRIAVMQNVIAFVTTQAESLLVNNTLLHRNAKLLKLNLTITAIIKLAAYRR